MKGDPLQGHESDQRTPEQIAVLIIYCEGNVLARRRPITTAWGGFWEFPGGKIQPGESPEEAAIRECEEETGLKVTAATVACVVDQMATRGPQRIHFLLAELPRESLPNFLGWDGSTVAPETPLPVDRPSPFRWVPIHCLRELKFPPANFVALAVLEEWIKNRRKLTRENSGGKG